MPTPWLSWPRTLASTRWSATIPASSGELPPTLTMRLASASSLTWSMIMLHSLRGASVRDVRELLRNQLGSFLGGHLVGLRPVLVGRHKTRLRRLARMAHPDFAVRMQTGAAGGGNGGEPGAVQQPCVGDAAVRMDAAIGRDLFFPDRLALREDGWIGQLSAVELVLVEIRDDL